MYKYLISLVAVLTTSPVYGQTAYELSLGLYEREVRTILGNNFGTIDEELSTDDQPVYENEQHVLFFCKKRLIAFAINLSPGVASWARAVETEKKSWGDPNFELQHRLWGGASAEWRMEPYRYLKIDMTQFDQDVVSVKRWQTDLRKCDM